MRLGNMLKEQRFSLVVSLPENNLELARAALKGGAQAIKVHANVWHRASGHTFGTYAENRDFLRELITLCGDVPVGLVPGGEEAFISREELRELEAFGLDFFSSYLAHLPVFMMHSPQLTKMAAIDSRYDAAIVSAVARSGIEVLECSIQPGERYGTPLNLEDVLRYADLSAKVSQPTLIPTQKRIKPEDLGDLCSVGCKAIMIGAVVMGKEPTPETMTRVCTSFRDAVERIG